MYNFTRLMYGQHAAVRVFLIGILCFGASFSIKLSAQTTLAVGDITIIGFNSNAPDNFSFVTWVPLTNNTYIKFTDNGFLSSNSANGNNNARGGENFVIWRNNTGNTIAAGTVITVQSLTTNIGVATAGSTNGLDGISNSGDQLFAYQGTATSGSSPDYNNNNNPTTFNGTVVYGLTFQGSGTAGWLTTGSASSNTSYLPSQLNVTNGNIAIGALASRGQYTGSRSNQTTLAAYKTLVNNTANWTTGAGAGTITLDATAFTVAAPVVNTVLTFVRADTTVPETAGNSARVYLRVTTAGNVAGSIDLAVSTSSIATGGGTDYTVPVTLNIPANTTVGQLLSFDFTINNDAIAEADEYVICRTTNAVNASVSGTTQSTLYIKDNDKVAPVASNQLNLTFLTSFSNGAPGSNSAEISAYDSASKRVFIANSVANRLDIVNFANPAAPVLINSVSLAGAPFNGAINSVDVHNGVVALALEGLTDKQANGKVVFTDINGNFIKEVATGAMPDMVVFNHAGTKVYTANEGEPNTTYTTDPEGSITVVDLSSGVANATSSNISFAAYNGQESTLRSQGIRIYGVTQPGSVPSTAAQDFEPEYITVSDDDSKAWVTLQENNAVVELNLLNNSIVKIIPLGYNDHSNPLNPLDASDQTFDVNLANFPVKGMYQPDAVGHYSANGNLYLITANEGDARAYSAFNEESRVNALTLDPTVFPNAADIRNNAVLGRLTVTNRLGDTDNDGDIDEIHCLGGRSFSIWNPALVSPLVYDSKDEIERIISTDATYSPFFNMSNTTVVTNRKNRSDDKGPEPEGVAVGKIAGNTFAFVALERVGGVLVYNVSNPAAPQYVSYKNNRALTNPAGPDLGAEGIVFIPATQSPNGKNLLILSNEISSTLSVFEVAPCAAPGIAGIASAGGTTICASGNIKLYNTDNNPTYTRQWFRNDTAVNGATDSVYFATQSGNYRLVVYNTTGCVDSSAIITITSLPNTFSGSGNWSDNVRWSCGAPPASGDNVTIAAGANAILDVDFTVAGTLTLTATSTLKINPARTLTISGSANFNGQAVTFISDNTGTASLGQVTGTLSGATNVTVERYIPNNGFRSWRLLSVPVTTTQTIRQAWQEGDINPLPKQNNLPGYGTQITGVFTTQAAAIAAGFDSTSVQAGILRWNGTSWSNVTGTNQPISNFNSYFLYIRGERGQSVTGSVNNSSATTLRTKGAIFTGDQTTNVGSNAFALIPNLYPSAINFTGLTRTGGISNLFYIWDSKKLNGSSLGVYQTFSATNNFNCLVGGGSYVLGQPNTTIESGQSFFVQSSTPGAITLKESAKVSGSNGSLGFRPSGIKRKIDTRLYNSSDEMLDANTVVFDVAYSKTIAAEDAPKMGNPGANFAIESNSKLLAVEGTVPMEQGDYIQFRMWNLAKGNYRLDVAIDNINLPAGTHAVLEDSYLKTNTVLNPTIGNSVSFTVDGNTASASANRFRLLIAKVNSISNGPSFTIAPNPVEGNRMNILFSNHSVGRYALRILSFTGQAVATYRLSHAGGSASQSITLPPLTRGIYTVEVASPTGEKVLKKIVAGNR